jgi:hypothetical protein
MLYLSSIPKQTRVSATSSARASPPVLGGGEARQAELFLVPINNSHERNNVFTLEVYPSKVYIFSVSGEVSALRLD